MIDRVLCSSSMAQLGQWLMLLLLRLLLLPGIAPALTFMAVGVDFLWPARRKKKNKNSFLVLYLLRCVFCSFSPICLHSLLCVGVAASSPGLPTPASTTPHPCCCTHIGKIFVESMRNAVQLPAF